MKRYDSRTLSTLLGLTLGANVALAALSPAPLELKSDQGAGEVLFTAVGNPAFINIEGKGTAPTGQLSIDGLHAKGKFEFALDTLDTGITKRNEHMKETYLKTKEFPKAVLEITDLILPKTYDPNSGLGSGDYKGRLTLKGETRDVVGKFSSQHLKRAQEKITAKFNLNLSDYKIEVPSFAGITVADKVEVSVETTLEPTVK